MTQSIAIVLSVLSVLSLLPFAQSAPLAPREDKTLEVPLYYKDHWWYIEVGVGSNNQTIRTVLDTGSSDTWFMSSSNPYCENNLSLTVATSAKRDKIGDKIKFVSVEDDAGTSEWSEHHVERREDSRPHHAVSKDFSKYIKRENYQEEYNQYFDGETIGNLSSLGLPVNDKISCPYYFNSSQSDTFHNNDTEFMIIYVNDAYAYGSFATDLFHFGDVTVDEVQFAVANEANISSPIFGIGAVDNEIVASRNKNGFSYPNFPKRLYESGTVSNYLYSISVNSSEGTGSILFGGSDSSKYDGELVALDIIPGGNGKVQDLYVNASYSYSNSSLETATMLALNAKSLVDIGSADLTFTSAAYDLFVSQFSDTKDSDTSSTKYFSCDELNKSVISISFGNNSVTVDYPLSAWAEEVEDGYCQLDSYVNYHTGSSDTESAITLGLAVYDRLYTIVDFETNRVSFAKARENQVLSQNALSSAASGAVSSTASASTTVSDPATSALNSNSPSQSSNAKSGAVGKEDMLQWNYKAWCAALVVFSGALAIESVF